MLRDVADRLHPPKAEGIRERLDIQHLLALPGAQRLDWTAFDQNDLRIRYRATDPVWCDVEGDGHLTDLREHLRRLCAAVLEITPYSLSGDWDAVAHNLRLAYSVTDLFTETDVDGAGMWCGPVADYEEADGEVTAKHLAATIVFNFVWSAYERAVETMRSGKGGRGARGRDLIVDVATGHIPYLREVMLKALDLDHGGTDFRHRDMRRMLKVGSIPGMAAEHLRQFRNRLTHGDLPKPEPGDWGAESKYVADQDPHLRKFHANIRLLLLLLQLLASEDTVDGLELESLLDDAWDVRLALRHLHCGGKDTPDQPELDLAIGCWPLPRWM